MVVKVLTPRFMALTIGFMTIAVALLEGHRFPLPCLFFFFVGMYVLISSRISGDVEKIVVVAHKHGWNGAENSKLVWDFFDNTLAERQEALEKVANMFDEEPTEADDYNDASERILTAWKAAKEVLP